MNESWERRLAEAWASIDDYDEDAFLGLIENVTAELPEGSAVGDFERACAFDSTGHSDLAVPLYRRALRTGLTGERRRRAVIQSASSLRNLGRSDESLDLLIAEESAGSDHLDGAVHAFLALALVDVGRESEAVGHALDAVAAHQPERSPGGWAGTLLGDGLDQPLRIAEDTVSVPVGREREAVSVLLAALAPHLPRYQRSVRNYARSLLGAEPGG